MTALCNGTSNASLDHVLVFTFWAMEDCNWQGGFDTATPLHYGNSTVDINDLVVEK